MLCAAFQRCLFIENQDQYGHKKIRNACCRAFRIFMVSTKMEKLTIGKLSGTEYDIRKKIISIFCEGLG